MAEIPLYCHSCHHQWQQQQTDTVECPACPTCGSASTEIITPEDDPRHFYGRQPTEPVLTAPLQPSTETTSATPEREMSDAPDHGPEGNPGNGTRGAEASWNPNPSPGGAAHTGPQFVFMFPPPAVTVFTTIVTSHVPPPNAEGPSGPPVAYFGMNFFGPPPFHAMPTAPPPTQANSPPSGADSTSHQHGQSGEQQSHPNPNHHDGQSTGGPAPTQVPFLSSLLSSIFNINPINASFGDAVFSQEALDRIISQLREASGPGGAPPASQTAIDKLEIRELDESMLDGDGAKSTRCVICVDEMTLGTKASILPCKHFFHGECVTPWLKQHNTCPVCRRPIEEEPVKHAKAVFTEEPAVQEQTARHAPDTAGCS